MYGWCSRYTQLKATQFFSVSQTPPLFLPPSPFPITPCITISPPFSPAAVTRATGNSKSCCWATAGSMLPALEKIERERKRERERPSSLSTKRYYCLATIHGLPHLPHPHHPLSLSRKKKTGWPWKVHSKRAITEDYYGVSPAEVIMVIWWEGLHHA